MDTSHLSFQDQYNIRLKEVLSESTFRAKLTKEWYTLALAAMRFNSPIGLGISATEMIELIRKLKNGLPFTYYEFAIVNNNLEARSSKDLGIMLDDYTENLLIIEELSAKWNKLTEEMRTGAASYIIEKQKAGSELNGMKSVKD